uniref:Uncharacterized protein n=1 Tax=Nelumbo nucifera TaxID=4432 RepID=A0A822Z3G4_NELNU|nr:TPA_asm: hypothetical protein HUJ06_008167 [Nelumbo nucifera]
MVLISSKKLEMEYFSGLPISTLIDSTSLSILAFAEEFNSLINSAL